MGQDSPGALAIARNSGTITAMSTNVAGMLLTPQISNTGTASITSLGNTALNTNVPTMEEIKEDNNNNETFKLNNDSSITIDTRVGRVGSGVSVASMTGRNSRTSRTSKTSRVSRSSIGGNNNADMEQKDLDVTETENAEDIYARYPLREVLKNDKGFRLFMQQLSAYVKLCLYVC